MIEHIQFNSVTQSCPTLWLHESQHARPPCPSPTPRVYSNSCLLSRWCHPTISFSVFPFSSCFQTFPASGSLKKNLPFSFFYFYFYFILLYNNVLVLPYMTWIRHGCTWVPNPEPPSHLSPHIFSLSHPSAPAPSILYPVSNPDWQFVSYMIVYMFQCHSPKSSHPLPLPQSPNVCSIHLCLFCCLTYRVIITIFLNSIYMC